MCNAAKHNKQRAPLVKTSNNGKVEMKTRDCGHLDDRQIQFENYFCVSDNSSCSSKLIQFPFSDSVTERSRRPLTAEDPPIELSGPAVEKKTFTKTPS